MCTQLTKTHTNDGELKKTQTGDAFNKEKFLKFCYAKAIFCLQTLFFGKEYIMHSFRLHSFRILKQRV